MMDIAISDVVVPVVDYEISEWIMDDESDDQNNNSVPSLADSDSPPIRKIFVGNLSPRASNWDLRHIFCLYGPVVDAHVSRDKFTHARKNFGFVTYKYPEDALSVLKLRSGELRLHFRNLYVAPADSWHQPVELPDGTVLWRSNFHGGLKHHQCHFVPDLDSSKAQSRNEASSCSENDSAAGDDKEIGAVGGHSSIRGELKQKGETEDDEEKGTKKGECKIDILNNDCLIHILSFLSKRERIKVERVCKRWQMVCLDMWVYQKHLDFTTVFPLPSAAVLNMRILRAFLKRCGSNLRSLDLSHKPHNFNASVLRIVASMCESLRYLNLAGVPVTSYGLRSLSAVSRELIVLNLHGCSGIVDKDLQNVFIHSPHLESVTLSHNSALTGKCLYGLSQAPLKDLVLDECNNLRSRNLVNGLLLLKDLKMLSLNSCMTLTSRDMACVFGALPKLHSLSLAGYFPLITSDALTPLDQLCDLISLNLHLNAAVNDEIMNVITRSCRRIEELNITGCSFHSQGTVSVTEVGFLCLTALPNLINLDVSYSAKISDAALEAIASRGKLQKLVCRGCPSLTDVGCISVVTSCDELEHFDFSGCDLVSHATVQAALDSVKLRTNNIKLTMVVGATKVCELEALEEYPLLEVDFSDLCVTRLRPDFVDDVYFPPSGDEDYMDRSCYWDAECGEYREIYL